MKTKILFAAAESVPFFKTGGLADVIGSLPEFLAESAPGVEVKVILPFYRRLADFEKECSVILESKCNFADRDYSFRMLSLKKQNVEYLFCDQPELLDRDAIYGPAGKDYPDNLLRFGFFSYAALRCLPEIGFQPDIVHCHDWHAGLMPVYLRELFSGHPFYRGIKSIITIHNLGYQGLFPETDWPMLSLPKRLFNPEGLEFYGKINLLKAGLLWADRITTVSPTYSEEIKTPEFGQGLEGILSNRAGVLTGILNGIDYSYWNPESDPLLKQNYGARKISGKSGNKADLFRRFSLEPSGNPLLGVVSRLVPPKGFDLIMEALPQIIEAGFSLAILGSGLPKYEEFFAAAAKKFQGVFGFTPGYNEELAHLIYGGSDFFLMPSLFEPCGLGQMIALRYGTVPIVRRTGGLADSVFDFDGVAGNGFRFVPAKAQDMLEAIKRAGAVYHSKTAWPKIVSTAFASDFSWSSSAERYLTLYRSVIER